MFTIAMRKVERNVLRTNAGMFRYSNDNNLLQSNLCKAGMVLQEHKNSFKIMESIGALISLSGFILVLIFWGASEFNIMAVPFDAQQMKTEWESSSSADWKTGFSDWHDKYYRDRTKVKAWVQHHYSTTQSYNANQIQTLLRAYENVPKYPATVYLYDVGSVRQTSPTQAMQTNAAAIYDNLAQSSTPAPDDLKNLFAANTLNPYMLFRRGLHDQCENKLGFDKMYTEQWDDRNFYIMDTVMNSYTLNLWGILIIIYLCSFLFQTWRVYEYGNEYRPVQPDGLRWVEYGITSPLMLAVIAVSAGIRSVSLFVVLIFIQLALIVFGYMLEILQDDYVTWIKYRFLADKTQLFPKNGQKLRLNAPTSDEDSDDTEKDQDKKPDQLVLDDFLDVIQNVPQCSANDFNFLGSITRISDRRRFVVDFMYFIAFSICGVIWTVILVHLFRSSYMQDKCSVDSQTPQMPFIVWFIVFSQMFGFFSFGVVSAVIWYQLRASTFNLMNSESNSQKSALEEFKTNCYRAWSSGSFYYCILNIAVKSALEISIFVFVSMYKAEIQTIPSMESLYPVNDISQETLSLLLGTTGST